MTSCRSVALVLVSVLGFALGSCSSGESDAGRAEPLDSSLTDSPLVTVPAPAIVPSTAPDTTVTIAPEATTPRTTATSTTTTVPAVAELAAWDWGAPCRVPVVQTIAGTGPLVERTFTVVVTEDPRGYRIDFDDLVTDRRQMSESELAEHLLVRAAVLPSIIVDGGGAFVEFVDLPERLSELGRQLAVPVEFGDSEAASAAETVRRDTIGGWYEAWQGRTLEPGWVETLEQRSVAGANYQATITVSGVPRTSTSRDDEFGEGRVILQLNELGDDLDARVDLTTAVDPGTLATWADLYPWYFTVSTTPPGATPAEDESESIAINRYLGAIVESTTSRPDTSYSEYTLKLKTGQIIEPLFRNGIRSTFDWENAEGCK